MAKGFGFIELLLCCLLFSLSMIGAISCQLYARQQVIHANQRLQATALLGDLLASMQGSPHASQVFAGQFDRMLPQQYQCRRAGDCDAAAMATSQLNRQLSLLFQAKILPDANLCVAANPGQPRFHLSWQSQSPLKTAPVNSLCPVKAGRQFVEISAQVGR
jgi:Tfp pilus assembly protein PilV